MINGFATFKHVLIMILIYTVVSVLYLWIYRIVRNFLFRHFGIGGTKDNIDPPDQLFYIIVILTIAYYIVTIPLIEATDLLLFVGIVGLLLGIYDLILYIVGKTPFFKKSFIPREWEHLDNNYKILIKEKQKEKTNEKDN